MLGFNVLRGILHLSCVLAVCAAPTEDKPKVLKFNGSDVANGTRRAISDEMKLAIQSALVGYDIVLGDPINVINNGVVRDKGIQKQIFKYDPLKDDVQVSGQTGCSSTRDSSIISTVSKFRQQIDTEAEVSGSVSGGGFGVSAEFSFSGSVSSTEVEDHMAKQHGSLTVFTMTCSSRHLDVGFADTGIPEYIDKFKLLITDVLGKVTEGDDAEQKAGFKSLISRYGTHYVSQSTIGARVTTVNFLSQALTSSMSQSKIKACASVSAKAEYMGIGASVGASGCGASDKEKFNSRDKGVTKTVKNSYGTTKVAGEGDKFSMDTMKDPRPLWIRLSQILDLFKPDALRWGIPEKFSEEKDKDGIKRQALSTKILSWLEPMFDKEDFKTNYCEAFKDLPNCNAKLTAAHKKGCGYTGSCGMRQKCEDDDTEPFYKCILNVAGTTWDWYENGEDLSKKEKIELRHDGTVVCNDKALSSKEKWRQRGDKFRFDRVEPFDRNTITVQFTMKFIPSRNEAIVVGIKTKMEGVKTSNLPKSKFERVKMILRD